MFVCMYISISIFIFVIGRNQMKTVSVCLYMGMAIRTVSLCEVILLVPVAPGLFALIP